MNHKILIASDSTCDLNPELIERYGVKIVPLGVSLSGEQYTDGVDIDPDMIYKHYEETGDLPKTSAINMAEFEDFFAEMTKDGSALIFFTISSEISSTYNNARMAAEAFENVHVIDTRNLSTGGGLLVCAAGDMMLEGKLSASEIAEKVRALTDKVDASFVIDNLEYLHKGGRCSAVAAFGANLLKLKPCITVRNGKMGVDRKYRGKFDIVLQKYVGEQIGDPDTVSLDRVFITHAGVDQAIVDSCVKAAKVAAPFAEVQVTRAGCTVSSHCGRNTLGVLFIRKEAIK